MSNAKAVGPDGLLVELLKLGLNKTGPSCWSSTDLPPSSGARKKYHSNGKTRSLPYSTIRETSRKAETIAASRLCHTRVRCSLKWLPGDLAITVRPTDCYRSSAGFDRIVHRLQEFGRKTGASLSMCFINLQKVYNTVNRTLRWQVLTCIEVPPQMIAVIRQYHHKMRARV